jgi:hypothetical protein
MAPAIAQPKALKTAWNVVAAGRNRTNHLLNPTIVEKPPSPGLYILKLDINSRSISRE